MSNSNEHKELIEKRKRLKSLLVGYKIEVYEDVKYWHDEYLTEHTYYEYPTPKNKRVSYIDELRISATEYTNELRYIYPLTNSKNKAIWEAELKEVKVWFDLFDTSIPRRNASNKYCIGEHQVMNTFCEHYEKAQYEIIEGLLVFIRKELKSLHVKGVTGVSSNNNEIPELVVPSKLTTILTVKQLAILFRALQEEGILSIEGNNKKEYSRIITSFITTKKADKISIDGLYNSFSPSGSTSKHFDTLEEDLPDIFNRLSERVQQMAKEDSERLLKK